MAFHVNCWKCVGNLYSSIGVSIAWFESVLRKIFNYKVNFRERKFLPGTGLELGSPALRAQELPLAQHRRITVNIIGPDH